MTVACLIQQLQSLDPTLEVIVENNDNEYGSEEYDGVTPVVRNGHVYLEHGETPEGPQPEPVVQEWRGPDKASMDLISGLSYWIGSNAAGITPELAGSGSSVKTATMAKYGPTAFHDALPPNAVLIKGITDVEEKK